MAGCFPRILFTCAFLVTYCYAQDFKLRSFSFDDGIKTYNIYKTIQDNNGFIWLATQDGMYRFNGKTFDELNNSTAESILPIGNAFVDAVISENKKIYVADYHYGIDIIDPDNLHVQQIKPVFQDTSLSIFANYGIEKVCIDNNNNLWIGGSGFVAVKRNGTEHFVTVTQSLDLDPSFEVSFIKPVSQAYVAVGIPGHGMLLFNIKSTSIIDKSSFKHPESRHIRDVVLYNDTLMGVTEGEILIGKFSNSSWNIVRSIPVPFLKESIASSIVRDSQARIWIGTNQGLIVYNMLDEKFDVIRSDNVNPHSLQDNSINHLLIDNQNNLWISTSKSLQVASLNPSFFTSYTGASQGNDRMEHVYTLVAKNRDQIYATGTDGLYEVHLPTRTVTRLGGTSALGTIHHLEKMDERFWIMSTDLGMFGFIPATNTVSQEILFKRYPEWTPFGSYIFNTAYRYQNSLYWASEQNEGLVKWDVKSGVIKNYKAGAPLSRGVPENHIRNLKKDAEGKLWLLSDNTVARFDLERDSVLQVIRYSSDKKGFRSKLYSDMYDDGRSLWFCTYGGGMNGYNKSSGRWTYIDESNGLSNNCVYSVLPENDSIFWVSTNMGLSRVNTRTGACANYFDDDGLQDNSFDEKGALKIGSKLYFGGVNGFTEVDLDKYKGIITEFPAYIHRVDYYVNGKQVILNNLEWDDIQLPSGTNLIVIHVSALTYSSAHKIKFSYKIGGAHDSYIDVGTSNTINLNTLSHGNYTVQIRFTREDGSVSAKELSLNFYIRPKWYQTWWFRVAMAVLICLIAYGFYYLRISQIKKENEIRSKLARDLHDDLGGTMNSIKIYASLAERNNDASHLARVIDLTREATTHIRDTIWVLDDKTGNFEQLIARLNGFAAPLCHAKNIDFVLNTSADARQFQLNRDEKRHLYMIMKEGVNNAVKYSNATEIRVTIEIRNGKPEVQISDNGEGFNTENATGGNGLTNMQLRAELIKYSYKLHSVKNEGTVIQMKKR